MDLSRMIVRSLQPEDVDDVVAMARLRPDSALGFARDRSVIEYLTRYPGVTRDSAFVAIDNNAVERRAYGSHL